MKKQNSETKNDVLGFEVALETLGEGASYSSKKETKKLKPDVNCGSKPTEDANIDLSFVAGVSDKNKIRKLLNRKDKILRMSEDDEPFRGFHEGTM